MPKPITDEQVLEVIDAPRRRVAYRAASEHYEECQRDHKCDECDNRYCLDEQELKSMIFDLAAALIENAELKAKLALKGEPTPEITGETATSFPPLPDDYHPSMEETNHDSP